MEKFIPYRIDEEAASFEGSILGEVKAGFPSPAEVMHLLFEDTEALEREQKLTTALENINSTLGKGTVKLAVQGSGQIKNASNSQSPHYTTRWSDIPKVKV